MSERALVTDRMVESVLTWARNYEQIVDYRRLPVRGRKWEVTIARPLQIGSGFFPDRPENLVPQVMAFTNREALAFGYGLTVGGESKPRRVKREEWDW